jgi:cytochrome c-type biogenesis protein CcmH
MLNRALFIVILSVLALFSANAVYASPVETFEFQDEVTKIRFQAFSKELRCPKCQNQNLADSNSTVASALRLDLYNLLIEGKSDTEIVDIMVSRYGEFVLYRPRVSNLTYVLWFGPALLIFIGIMVMIVILRKKPVSKESLALNTDQQTKLEQLLADSADVSSTSKSASEQKAKE